MKSIAQMYDPVKTALISVSENVGKGEAIDATVTHLVYQIDSEGNSFNADDGKEQQVLQGTIDLYALTKDENKYFDGVQKALNDAGVSFYLNSVQFEDMELNNFIHYEWVFEVS